MSASRGSADDDEVDVLDEVLRDGMSDCLKRAAEHKRVGRAFLISGLGISVASILFYIFFLAKVSVIESVSAQEALKQVEPIVPSEWWEMRRDSATEEEKDEVLRAVTKSLQTSSEGLRMIAEAMVTFNWKLDGLPLIRNTLGFFFIQLIAGYLLALYSRNEIQALHWYSQRQVYERLLLAPLLVERLKVAGLKPDTTALQLLLTPIVMPVHRGTKDSNPSLTLLTAMSDTAKARTGPD